ncbi:hypothetical protein AB1N83_013791 [Pleurotus pulmonarius]
MSPVPGVAIPDAQSHSRITINTHSRFPVHPWLTHHFAPHTLFTYYIISIHNHERLLCCTSYCPCLYRHINSYSVTST